MIVSNGNVHLDWVEIGNVLSVGNDDYNFTYGPQENVTTVWGGESSVMLHLHELHTLHHPVYILEYNEPGQLLACTCNKVTNGYSLDRTDKTYFHPYA